MDNVPGIQPGATTAPVLAAIERRTRHHWLIGGLVHEIDVIDTLAARWPSHPAAALGVWSVIHSGGRVQAVRVVAT